MPSSTVFQTIIIVIIDVHLIVGLEKRYHYVTHYVDQSDLKPRDLLASVS